MLPEIEFLMTILSIFVGQTPGSVIYILKALESRSSNFIS
jgi:hypothetical protein